MKTCKDCINENYLNYVKTISPKTNEKRSIFRAFWVGGFICSIGEALKLLLSYVTNLSKDDVSAYVSFFMIFIGALLTGLGVYDRIGKYAGGGSIVPITGFANSVVSPSMEFKTEGYIFGTAAKMFVVAGPIIVFGVASSVLVGLIYFIINQVV